MINKYYRVVDQNGSIYLYRRKTSTVNNMHYSIPSHIIWQAHFIDDGELILKSRHYDKLTPTSNNILLEESNKALFRNIK